MSRLPTYLSITEDPNKVLSSLIERWKPDHIAVLADENTKEHCLPHLSLSEYQLIAIESGEENKTLAACEQVWRTLTEAKFTRKSLLINLGGGVIGDLGGFAAATYKRGIRFINIPTTLLSQVDASIGGKLGVDFGVLKNHIGIFRAPDQVIVHTGFLSTLPDRELTSGFAEVIKHALISDKHQWDFLMEKQLADLNLDELVPSSIAIKNSVVEADPMEQGLRKILNFGHTLGHALESHFLLTPQKLLHGEAIAIGMILESHISYQKGWLTKDDFEVIRDYLQGVFNLPDLLPDPEILAEALLQDKKNDALGVSFSIIRGIGTCAYDVRISNQMIKESFAAY